MSLLKQLIDKMLPKKRVPIPVRKSDYEIQRDIYLDELLTRLEKNNFTVDADMYDKL